MTDPGTTRAGLFGKLFGGAKEMAGKALDNTDLEFAGLRQEAEFDEAREQARREAEAEIDEEDDDPNA